MGAIFTPNAQHPCYPKRCQNLQPLTTSPSLAAWAPHNLSQGAMSPQRFRPGPCARWSCVPHSCLSSSQGSIGVFGHLLFLFLGLVYPTWLQITCPGTAKPGLSSMAKRTAPKCSQALPAMGSNSVAENNKYRSTHQRLISLSYYTFLIFCLKLWRESPAAGAMVFLGAPLILGPKTSSVNLILQFFFRLLVTWFQT